MKHILIFFDGECAFCNASIHFIIKHDKKNTFRFASLQSIHGQSFLAKYPELQKVDSLILVKDGTYSLYSSAVLKITKQLHGMWKCFWIFTLIPKPLRDYIYRIVARYRKQLKKDSMCYIFSTDEENRFLT